MNRNKLVRPMFVQLGLTRLALLCTILFSLQKMSYAQIHPFDYKGDTLRVAGEVTIALKAKTYELKLDRANEAQIKIIDFGATSSPGDPILPYKVFDVVVPPNIDWRTVKLEFKTTADTIAGRHIIKPAPPLRARVGDEELIDWGEGKNIVNGRNMRVYGLNSFYPGKPVTIISQSQMRRWKFLRVGFTPIQYNPITQKLILNNTVQVNLTFKRIGTNVFRTNPILNDTLMDAEARQRFINLKEAQEWYRYVPGTPSPKPRDDQDPDYVIITTNAIVSGSGSGLTNFVNHKESLGHTVRVVTEHDYGSLTGQAPNGMAEKIRQWLINNYVTLGIKWVLLIGNPDPDDPSNSTDTIGDIPMKMCWPRNTSDSYRESPTDHFYANLAGNWDLDNDGFYGESTGDNGAGGVDFTPDLYVGRIPVYNSNYTTLNHIIQKIIDYETQTSIPAWRRKLLIAAVHLWDAEISSDYNLGEALKKDFADPLGFSTYRIYESDFGITPPPECPAINPPDSNSTKPCNMLQELVHGGGYGVVGWSTHGGPTGASGLITSGDCSKLDDTKLFFTFQGSCLTGKPEMPTNLGYSLLTQGGIATVSASRVSWNHCFDPSYDPNPASGSNCNLNYYYFKRLLNGLAAGHALFLTKEDADQYWNWMNLMDYNIYGDPTATLLKPYLLAKADVVPVLDHSGSMQGYTSTSKTDRKIDVLKYAANQFVDILDADAGHQLGLIKFSSTAAVIMNLQPFTAASATTAHARIDQIESTNLTSIGDGLRHAVAEFIAHGNTEHRRVILLVTDGMENTAPMIAEIQEDITNNKVTVFPLGLGYSSGIDEAKLIELANKTGGDYRITDDDLIFRKYFIELLGSAVDWSVVTDPILTLSANESASIPVTISSIDNEALFTAYWSDFDNAIELSLRSPSGRVFNSSSNTYVGKNRYSYYLLNLRRLSSQDRTGNWSMTMKAKPGIGSDKQVRLSASALVRSGTQMSVGFDKPTIYTGDRSMLKVHLVDGGKPLIGAKVVARCDQPSKGFGNVMHDNPVDLKKVKPISQYGDSLKPLQLKVTFLQQKLGKNFMPRKSQRITLYDDGTHGDDQANDGVYANSFGDTKVPGSYSFHLVASNVLIGSVKTTREWTKVLHSEVNINPTYSIVDVKLVSKTVEGWRYLVKVAPRDRFGNYMSPGHSVNLKISYQGIHREIVLNDNLDGMYSKEILLSPSELQAKPQLEIAVDGKSFTLVKRIPN
ncbi:MAG: hypothetical protein ILNGONEN_01996 [Syntrophorhabdaceae bacterium]|nr:hypothetical protein [Syntrophorhabdaceae bacterium]